jgi:uncharacterized repeat protein (TIGR03847 family)
MSRRVFSFDPPDRFVCGAIGQPGERTFFLQASKGQQVVTVGLEKVQVAALAERLAALLLSLKERGVEVDWSREPDAQPLAEPLFAQFRVGAMTLAWDEDREQVLIEAREMTEAELESDEDDPQEEAVLADGPDGPDLVRVILPAADAQAFVTRAVAVVRAGRLPCPNCGEPLDPRGHFCVRRNGYAH